MSCNKFNVGYKGQRFEVRYTRDEETKVFGWTNERDGGVLADSAKLMPGVVKVEVIDLFENAEV